MMMCHPTKFECKKISSSIDMSVTYSIIWALTVTLNLKTANLLSCMTLGSMMVHHQSSLVTKGSAVEEISLRWIFTGILNLSYDLDLAHNRANKSFHKTIQLMIRCHQTKLYLLRKDQQFKRYIMKSSLVTWSFTVTLILKTANQYFWKTVWLMMMHYRTEFGSIKFSISEDSIWINSHWHFEILPWPWPWTQQSNFFIRHSGLW